MNFHDTLSMEHFCGTVHALLIRIKHDKILPTCRLVLRQHSTRLTSVEITSLMVSWSRSDGKKRDYQINNTVIVYLHMKMLAKHTMGIYKWKERRTGAGMHSLSNDLDPHDEL